MKTFRDKLTEGKYLDHILIILAIILLLGSIAIGQSKQEVKREIIKQGIKKPLVVTAQAFYESGHLKSHIYNANNNLFGMREAKVRRTTAKGTRYNHAYYTNWKQSIKDYKIWQLRYYKGGNYYDFLQSYGYAESKKYIETLKQIRV